MINLNLDFLIFLQLKIEKRTLRTGLESKLVYELQGLWFVWGTLGLGRNEQNRHNGSSRTVFLRLPRYAENIEYDG